MLRTNFYRSFLGVGLVLVLVLVLGVGWLFGLNRTPTAQAESNFQRAWLEHYPNARSGALDSCALCHTTGAELNAYGKDFGAHGHNVVGIEWYDSDSDGFANNAEINAGTFPGDANSRPTNLVPAPAPIPAAVRAASGIYKLIAWNDLGMHCMGPNYSNMHILPPYNTVWAQLILQGETPQIVTEGVTVEYYIENNTYSAGKTNFWDNAQALFGVNLPPNVGLKGNGLAGVMTAAGDHFIVEGIPLTPYLDGATPIPDNWYPYQIGHLTAKDSVTGDILAETRPVVPVSEEMHCETCHADGMQENIATGNVETNILTLHDEEENTHLMQNRPVLCQQCHGDNALGVPGNPNLPNLSRAMHEKHKLDGGDPVLTESDPDNLKPSRVEEGTNNCYLCHPGEKTKCLRDVMYTNFGVTCRDCHGDTAALANPARRPWIDLPRCENCHAAQYAENPNTLYRFSKGHGGLYCEACHGSPHAIQPSSQPNDNLQNIALQGYAGTLDKCEVCHGSVPAGPGPHQQFGSTPTPTPTRTTTPTITTTPTLTPTATNTPECTSAPDKPLLVKPKKTSEITKLRVPLDWNAAKCANWYNVIIRKGNAKGEIVDFKTNLTETAYQTIKLARGNTYYWRVQACNLHSCTNSLSWSFTIKPK